MQTTYDIVIIGTGAGGGTLAYALRNSGAKVSAHRAGRLSAPGAGELGAQGHLRRGALQAAGDAGWMTRRGKPSSRASTTSSAATPRSTALRCPASARRTSASSNTKAARRRPGPSPTTNLEPYYARGGEDLLGPWPDSATTRPNRPDPRPIPFRRCPTNPTSKSLVDRLRDQGLHPFHYPMGIDLRDGGRCIRCKTCDGFPCKLLAKADADVCCVRPALESPDVTLWPRTLAHRLLTDETGRRITAWSWRRMASRSRCRPRPTWSPAVRSTRPCCCCARPMPCIRTGWPTDRVRWGATTWSTTTPR